MYKGKRLFDFILSFSGIIFLSPLLIVIALFVLISSGWPIIYKQKRVGRNWKIFNLYKFRTMIVGAEKEGYICKEGDERVTLIGSFLRKYKLDELLQLFNVLKGDMSLVGPRPEVPEFVKCYKEGFDKILSVNPGITDPSSIRFQDEACYIKGASNPKEYYLKEILPRKMEMNLAYLRQATIGYDLTLIFKTLYELITKNDGYFFDEIGS